MKVKRGAKDLTKKSKMMKGTKSDKRGVILLSHIPHGFYEREMFDFFSQFGEVTRLKLIRSKKTGRSKSFAFIEFQFEEVAKIAAETMDNYLMFQKILKCKLIPLEEVKPLTFKNWNTTVHVDKSRSKAITMHNMKTDDPEKIRKRQERLKEKREALQQKLKELEIDYDVMNIKINESFVPPKRSPATEEEVSIAKRNIYDRENTVDNVSEESDLEMMSVNDENKQSPCKDNPESEQLSEKTSVKKYHAAASEEKELKAVKEQDVDFGVMVTDLDDPEVTFRTPPPDAKIRRKSIGASSKKKKDNEIEEEMRTPSGVKGKHATESRLVEDFTGITPGSRRKSRKKKLQELSLELDSPEESEEKKTSATVVRKNKRLKISSTPCGQQRTVKKTAPMTERKVTKKKRKLNVTM